MPFVIDLKGRRALVTGAGQGVGRGIAAILAVAGADILVNDYYPDRAEAVAAEIREKGGRSQPAPFDVTDYEAVAAAVDQAGAVDILVNNAGNAGANAFQLTPFADTTPADWERYFSVNVYGVMNCSRAVIPGMIDRQDGRIITIISDAGRWGEPRMAAYSAAKAGAAGFTRSLARDVGRHGITVNNIALGRINTGDRDTGSVEISPEVAERYGQQLRNYIIRRPGKPEDIGALVTFLASPQASWITGQTYPVNGGYTVNQ
jgi:3-oxoacyl-[acyl-carrier protein] reductase